MKLKDNQSIVLHGRDTTDRKRHGFIINDFFPFFGVENTPDNVEKVLVLEKTGEILGHEFFFENDPDKPYFDQFGRNVVVIYVKDTGMVKILREKFSMTYQDDVKYERVFKIKKNIHTIFTIDNFTEIQKREPICPPGVKYTNPSMFRNYRIVSHHDIRGF